MNRPVPIAEIVIEKRGENALRISCISVDAARWIEEEIRQFGDVVVSPMHLNLPSTYFVYVVMVEPVYDIDEVARWLKEGYQHE